MKLLIATRNRHKFGEISAILAVPGLQFLNPNDFPDLPEVIEDGVTFEANARKKALCLAQASGRWTLADDSGLEVEALQGAPGVYSARYAGVPSNDEANNCTLLRNLTGITHRNAQFRCVIALAGPDHTIRTVEGICPGTVLNAPRGAQGFGYDPLFVPCGHSRTFAELDASVKNTISHRAQALRKARTEWDAILTQREA